MDSAWVLRSPHADGVHLVVRALPGAHETLARLVSWTPSGGGSGLVDVLDATMLPAGIQAVSWCGSDASSPVRLATCSTETLHVVDLAYHTHPRRVRNSFKPDGVGALCAGVAWAGSSGRLVVFARGGSVCALDAETSARVWSFPAGGHKEIPSAASVASLATINEQTVVASWSAPSSDAGDAGSIRLLDLRAPPTPAQRTAVASGTAAVRGLCAAPLEPHLVASHAETEGHSEVFVWDVRSRCTSPRPVGLLHGGGAALTLGPLQRPVGLEWSPGKSGTLLAVSTGGPLGASVQACRLWPVPEANGGLEKQLGNGLVADAGPTSWAGDARTMRLVPPPSAGNTSPDGDAAASCSDIVAAGWAHSSRPGLALALRNGGAVVALEQRSARLAAWSPRGGAAVVRQWPAASPAGNEPRDLPKEGLPAVLEESESLAAADVCCVMRERAERFDYGVQKQGFDEYSRIVRATGRHSPASEALALMWQWAKLADSAAGAEQEVSAAQPASPQSWKGVQMTLSQDEQAPDEASEPFRGVFVYGSPGRRRSLQVLGYPEVETAAALADAGSPQVDDVVRRILRAVLFLQFDRAATECELLEPHCGASARLLLPQLVLVFHAAACLLAGAVRDMEEEEGAAGAAGRKVSDPAQASSAALSSSVHAFRATMHNLLDLHWHDLPSAGTLRLALRFVNVAVTACTFVPPVLPLSAGPGRDMGGMLVRDTFEDMVRALLSAGASDGAGGLRGVGGVAAAPAAGLFSVAGEPTASARPSLAFRCGLALRFLCKASLDATMDAIFGECVRGGLPDGLCALGLGGADGTPPVTAGMLEELSGDSAAALPPPLPLSPSSTRRSASMPSMAPLAELGDSQSVPVGGLVDDGASLIGTYVAWTGDVQSAALLFCHSAHLLQPPLGLRRCFAQYAALLARWQLYRQRAGLHALLTARPPLDEPTRSRGPVIFCCYCNGPLTGPLPSLPGCDTDAILRRCPNTNCAKATPSCAVCLLPIFVVRSRTEDPDRGSKQSSRLAVDSWVAWCQNCHHGGHMAHLEEWFATHNECPVAGCDCPCTLY